jgi:hypothetical protein
MKSFYTIITDANKEIEAVSSDYDKVIASLNKLDIHCA